MQLMATKKREGGMTKKSAVKKAPSILTKYAVHNPDVAWRIVDGEAAIVTPADGTLHLLNEVGTAVWLGTERPVQLSKVVERILDEFEVKRSVAEKDVAAFAAELSSKAMLLVARRRQDLPVPQG